MLLELLGFAVFCSYYGKPSILLCTWCSRKYTVQRSGINNIHHSYLFRFGKHRKGNTDHLPRLTMQDLERQKLEAEKLRAKKAAEDEQER